MERDNADWRKSTYSSANGGQCVEVGNVSAGVVVRDTTNREGTVLGVPSGAWQAFLGTLRA
jgi:hypothetical protein